MEFKELREMQQNYVAELLKGVDTVFVAGISGDQLWNIYMEAFPAGTNNIFRKRKEFDCSCCRNFIRQIGNVVVRKNGKWHSIWGFDCGDPVFQQVIDTLDYEVLSSPIEGVFVSKVNTFGTSVSHELDGTNVVKWNHFFLQTPTRLASNSSLSVETIGAEYRVDKEVLQASLEQIGKDALETVIDLITQNSLYRGEEWLKILQKFSALKDEFCNAPQDERSNWCWIWSTQVGAVVSRLKNHSIGTLLIDISQGTDLEEAVKKYDKIVAPQNYKRPQAIFTARMVEDARKTVKELGLLNSLPRRFARLSDITINDVLFADRSAMVKMAGDPFGSLAKKAVITSTKSFDKVEEVPVDKFVSDILPRATGLEVLVENDHIGNMMSLIAPVNGDAPSILKWPNNFSWAYKGNVTDSMKENVARMGGKVDGVLRFSIQWNEKGSNPNDYDAHAKEPGRYGEHIYFSYKRNIGTTGMLDVDIVNPNGIAVENITWTDRSKMIEGDYKFSVHCFNHRGGVDGFRAEIEFDGTVYEFNYPSNIPQGVEVVVAKVNFSRQNGFKLLDGGLKHQGSKQEVWGIATGDFVPVLAVSHSPNFWDGNTVGNRHTFFFLKGCINPDQPNGFYNEFLHQDLMKHKRVFEALGKEMKVEKSDEQLSGLGFSSTKHTKLVVKVKGATERIIKVVF